MQGQETSVSSISQAEWQSIVTSIASNSADHDPRRNNPREPFTNYEDVKLNILIAGVIEHYVARITELSLGGVTCWTEREVPERVKVMFQFHPDQNPVRLRGRIVHCTQTIGGYKVGIELEFPE